MRRIPPPVSFLALLGLLRDKKNTFKAAPGDVCEVLDLLFNDCIIERKDKKKKNMVGENLEMKLKYISGSSQQPRAAGVIEMCLLEIKVDRPYPFD